MLLNLLTKHFPTNFMKAMAKKFYTPLYFLFIEFPLGYLFSRTLKQSYGIDEIGFILKFQLTQSIYCIQFSIAITFKKVLTW